MADSTLPVDLNLTPSAFSTAWADYLVTKVTTGPYTVGTHAATRHLGPTQNFVENCLLQFQEKTAKTILNIREYGAVADGATDDSAAIQAALDAAEALGGGVVHLGAGSIVIDSQLTIYDGTQLVGAGQKDTILEYSGTGYAIVQSTPETQIYGVRLAGFSITFDDGGLDLNSISESLFHDLHLQTNVAGTGTCARLQATASSQNFDNVFTACHFQGGAIGLQIGAGGANRNKVVACIIEDCTTGILITDGASNVIQSCTILDNTTGIQINESAGTLSQGNHIDSCVFDEQVTRNININTSGIDYTRVTGNFFATSPSADVNNGADTFAVGNLPLAAPWGILYSDVADIDSAGVATFAGGVVAAGDLLPDADSTYDLGGVGMEWAEAHIDDLYVKSSATIAGNIISDVDSSDDLGSDAIRWANLYVDNIICTGTIEMGASLQVGGNVVSDTDSTDSLGTDSVRWSDLYVDAVECTDQIKVNNTSGNAGSTADDLVVGTAGAGSDSYGLTIFGDLTGASRIHFGNSGDNNAGELIFNHTDTYSQITVDNTAVQRLYSDRMLINTSTPQIELGISGPRISAASGDIVSTTNIVSDTDSTDSLGSTSVRWAGVFSDVVTVTDQILVNKSSGISAASSADDIVIGTPSAGAEYHGMTIFGGITGGSRIHFGNSGDNDEGGIFYFHNLNFMQFTANGTASLLIYSDKIRVGTTTPTLEMGSGGPIIVSGSGTPESAVTADVGSIYMRTDGGAGTSMYVKESGVGNTGWIAK